MITLSNAMSRPVSLIKKNFVHNYCRTCHSFQGSTIDEAITIFDHKCTYNRSQGKIDCNLTAQRVCNNEAHHLDNVVPYCVYCNTAMSNR